MKQNYQAWEINPGDFQKQKTITDQLWFLAGFAVLAPSGHNSQPWQFDARDNIIDIRADMSRALPASDPNCRQLYISLGCAMENLLIAAEGYRFHYDIAYFPKDGVAASITFSGSGEQGVIEPKSDIIAVTKRHTNRNPYTTKMPEQTFLQKIKSLGTGNVQITLVSQQTQREKISDIVSEALITTMDNKSFRMELSRYLKPNNTNSPIGMTGAGFLMPTAVSFIAPVLIKFVNVNKLSKKEDVALLKEHTPVFGVISTLADEPKAWLKAGQLYERVAVEAEKGNIKTHPLAAAIETGKYCGQLQNALEIPSRPQVFFRLGYTDKLVPYAPRLPISKCRVI